MADALESTQHYTYRDYLKFPADMRCELVGGEIFMMASPDDWHQAMVVDMCGQLWNFFRGKPCQVRVAPFDVRLFAKENESDDTVVQPDLMVICDKSKHEGERACKGAPDFAIEVLSRSTKSHDLLRKRALYEKAGVREYWAVGMDFVLQYALVDGAFVETLHPIRAEPLDLPVSLFDGCVLRFEPGAN